MPVGIKMHENKMHIIWSGDYMVHCHLTSLFLPRKSVEKGITFYIWVNWCQFHPKEQGAFCTDTQKFVKQLLGESFWMGARKLNFLNLKLP